MKSFDFWTIRTTRMLRITTTDRWQTCTQDSVFLSQDQDFENWDLRRVDSDFELRQYSQPTYLSDQLVDYIPNHSLCSASQQLLLTKPTRTVLAQCSFTSAAPNIWNSLPEHLQQCCDLETFRRRLETYLFSSVYAAWAAYPRLRIAF